MNIEFVFMSSISKKDNIKYIFCCEYIWVIVPLDISWYKIEETEFINRIPSVAF